MKGNAMYNNLILKKYLTIIEFHTDLNLYYFAFDIHNKPN